MNSAAFERNRAAAVLRRHDFHFRKKYGQNFLTDPAILSDICDAAEITEEDYVLEIGPGMGTLTAMLATRAKGVLAIEIDDKLIPILQEELGSYDNVIIHHGDVMKTDLPALLKEHDFSASVKVVANLPYYITTPILMMLLEGNLPYESITVMVQKEVAERMQAEPGTKTYGALTLAVNYYTLPEIKFILSPEAFYPPPKVESAVISLIRHEEKPVTCDDEEQLFGLIRAAFNQRRKTLANGIHNGMHLPFTKEEIGEIIAEIGQSPTIRGEALTLAEFAALSDGITAHLHRKPGAVQSDEGGDP